MTINIDQANQKAIDAFMEARPVVVGVARAKDVIPGMHDNLFLHAGPPVTWDRMSGPVRGAMIGAMLLEGKANTPEEAETKLKGGEIEFAPCHHFDSTGPMAGVMSPSMLVYIVENKTNGYKAFSGLNEGRGKVLRMGAYSEEVLDRMKWLNEVLGPAVDRALKEMGGLDLRTLIAKALHMGDDGHNTALPGFYLVDIAHHFLVHGFVIGSNHHHGHFLINERNGTVLHLGRRIAFGMYVGDLL